MSGELRTIRLNDIGGFDYVYARMPTAEETERQQVPAGVPVLVMHFPEIVLPTGRMMAREQTYRADLVGFTIDTRPAPDPETEREAARSVLHFVIEDLTNTVDDLDKLAGALRGAPGDVRRAAERLREQRDATWAPDALIAAPNGDDSGNSSA